MRFNIPWLKEDRNTYRTTNNTVGLFFKPENKAKAGELFYNKAGIGRKGVSLEGVRKASPLIRDLVRKRHK